MDWAELLIWLGIIIGMRGICMKMNNQSEIIDIADWEISPFLGKWMDGTKNDRDYFYAFVIRFNWTKRIISFINLKGKIIQPIAIANMTFIIK